MRFTLTPNAINASTASVKPHIIPSIIARAISAGFEFLRFMPEKTPVASGRLGVRSPSKYGKSVRPWAPATELSANAPTSS